MLKPKRAAVVLSICCVILFAACTGAFADDAAVAKPAALPQVGYIAAKSLDSFTDFVKKTGLDLPPVFTTKGLEEQFPFLGPGSLDTTRPIGIVVCGGADISSGQSMAFVFPVKPTGATLDSLKALGKPIDDHPDTILVGTVGIRRTADYLIFSPAPAVATSVDTTVMIDGLKKADALAKLSIDLKPVRTSLPDQYKAMIDSFKASTVSAAASKSEQDGAMLVVKPLVALMDTTDRLDVGVESGEEGVRLSITATPLKIAKASPDAIQPGMPDSVVARVDLNLAGSDLTANLRKTIQNAFNTGAASDPALNADEKNKVEALGDKVGELIFDPDTTSTGVAIVNAQPVGYIVQHWSKKIDAAAEWTALANKAKTIPGTGPEDVKTDTYQEEGLTVVHIVVKSGNSEGMNLEVAQRDDEVFMVMSASNKHLIQPLLAAKPLGKMKGIFSGSIDLDRSLAEAEKFPNSPIAGLPGDTRKKLAELLAGQKLAITTSADGDSGTLSVTFTKGLLDNLPKLMEIINGPAK